MEPSRAPRPIQSRPALTPNASTGGAEHEGLRAGLRSPLVRLPAEAGRISHGPETGCDGKRPCSGARSSGAFRGESRRGAVDMEWAASPGAPERAAYLRGSRPGGPALPGCCRPSPPRPLPWDLAKPVSPGWREQGGCRRARCTGVEAGDEMGERRTEGVGGGGNAAGEERTSRDAISPGGEAFEARTALTSGPVR